MKRKIVVYDMNYFYAQVEELDNPELKEQSVVVGGNPHERGGIVATCNYQAHFLQSQTTKRICYRYLS